MQGMFNSGDLENDGLTEDSSIQHASQQARQTINISSSVHGGLGHCIWSHCCISDIWWTFGLSIHSRLCRSSLLRKSADLFSPGMFD